MLERGEYPTGYRAGVRVKLDRDIGILPLHPGDRSSDRHVHAELFGALPRERIGMRLAGFHLATGELPESTARPAASLTRDEVPAVLLDDRRGDDGRLRAHRPILHNSPIMLTYLKLVLAMLFYGVSFVSTKVALTAFGPVTILWIRLALSAGFLVALDAFLPGGLAIPDATSGPTATGHTPASRRWPLLSDLGPILLVTLFQPLLYFLAENIGLQYVSASIASIIIATIPVFTPVLARPFLGERVGMLTIAGLVLSLAGVAVIVLERQLEAQFTAGGLALIFVAVLAAVGYTIAVKSVPVRYRPLTIVKLQSLIGLPIVFVVALVTEGLPTALPAFDVIAHVLYLGIFPSSLAFVFLSGGIRAIGANRANVFVNLVPVFTALVAWALLGEFFTLQKLAGMAIVILGVLAAQRGQARLGSLRA